MPTGRSQPARRIQVWVPLDLADWLILTCQHRGMTRAEVVTMALTVCRELYPITTEEKLTHDR